MNNTETVETKKTMKPWIKTALPIATLAIIVGGVVIWKGLSSYAAIDLSKISAPTIIISPETPGILSEVYVKPGDEVAANTPVAQVGGQVLLTKIAGTIVTVQNTPGAVFAAGTPVVTMIDPTALRVVGTIDENKGLSSLKVGQPVRFTVDAFKGMTYVGVVDEISPTANTTGVLFKISDKRDIQQFDVKVRFDTAAHPEFKNGMSAKIRVYTK